MDFVVRHGLTGQPLHFVEQPNLRVCDLSEQLAQATDIPAARMQLITKKGLRLRP